jgi:hypothetical protein
VHILAVVVAFGITFAYPLFGVAGARMDLRAVPWFHRMQQVIGRRLISPALLIVLVAGIYLASHLHQWSATYVQLGLAAVVVLGGLEGGFMVPRAGRLADLAERDLSGGGTTAGSAASAGEGSDAIGGSGTAGPGLTTLSPEYHALLKRVGFVGVVMQLIVVVTVFLMATQAGS